MEDALCTKAVDERAALYAELGDKVENGISVDSMKEAEERETALVSSTGERLIVPYAVIKESSVLRTMVDGGYNFQESIHSTIHLPVTYECTKRVVEYLQYKREYSLKQGEVPDFAISDGENLDLLEVASFLRV